MSFVRVPIAFALGVAVLLLAPGSAAAQSNSAPARARLTVAEKQALRASLKALVRQDAEGLTTSVRPDGAKTVSLEGRAQTVTVATIDAAGNTSSECLTSPAEVDAWLAKLGDDAAPTTAPAALEDR